MGRSERQLGFLSWISSVLTSRPRTGSFPCVRVSTYTWMVCVCVFSYVSILIVCTVDVDTSFSVDACTYLSLCHLLAERKQPCTVFIS
jgi:hypothetical protein